MCACFSVQLQLFLLFYVHVGVWEPPAGAEGNNLQNALSNAQHEGGSFLRIILSYSTRNIQAVVNYVAIQWE